jgi:pimeloyl-ACP methyl ester carboxylesterase
MEPLIDVFDDEDYAYVIAPCLRNFGYSSPAKNKKFDSLRTFAEDIKIFMEEAYSTYKEYYVFGHGMGGMIACHLALIDPIRVRGLILLNTLNPDGYKSNVKVKSIEDLKK